MIYASHKQTVITDGACENQQIHFLCNSFISSAHSINVCVCLWYFFRVLFLINDIFAHWTEKFTVCMWLSTLSELLAPPHIYNIFSFGIHSSLFIFRYLSSIQHRFFTWSVHITYSNSQFNDSISRSFRFIHLYFRFILLNSHSLNDMVMCVCEHRNCNCTISMICNNMGIRWVHSNAKYHTHKHTSSGIHSILPNISREFWRLEADKIPFDHENVCVCMYAWNMFNSHKLTGSS